MIDGKGHHLRTLFMRVGDWERGRWIPSHVYVILVKKADGIFFFFGQKSSRFSLVVIGLIANRTLNASLVSAIRLFCDYQRTGSSVHFN